jgi:tripartite-type tricarboxylate transporter receptor subunit TctC
MKYPLPLLKRITSLGAALGLVAAPIAQSMAQGVDFSGKRINITVGAAGGGSDVYMRTIAPFLEKYLPGKPSINIQQISAGGSLVGANEFEARSKPDGLHAIVVTGSTIASYVFERSRVNYRMDKWEPVVLSPQGAMVYVGPNLGVKGPQDLPKLKGQKLILGGQGPSKGEFGIMVPLRMLDLDVRGVWGLMRGKARLAFEREEFNVNFDSAPGWNKRGDQLTKSGKAVPIFSLGVMDEQGNIVRDPNFPEIMSFPEAYELMHGKKPSGIAYEAYRALFQMRVMANKSIWLPAGTPKPILDAWRTAIRQVFADPEFMKRGAEEIAGYSQFFGEAAHPVMKEAISFSPEVWAWLDEFLKKHEGMSLGKMPAS